MPIYSWRCPDGHLTQQFLPVAQHTAWTAWAECNRNWAAQIIHAPLSLNIQQECRYDSPMTGEPITTWAQRANDLAKHRCQPYEPGMRQDRERNIKENDAA